MVGFQWLVWIEMLQRSLRFKKNKIMASGLITSWQIEGGKVEAVTYFLFLVSKITADGDCSHEIKRHLLLGRQAMTNLDSVLKSRDITSLTMVYMIKAIFFPVIKYRFESWTMKKAECKRIDSFKWWCWRRLLTLDSKEIKPVSPKRNQPWIFIVSTAAEAEAPILWPPDAKSQLMLGKIEGKWRGQQRMRWLHSITNPMDMNLSTFEIVKDKKAWWATAHELESSQTHLPTEQQDFSATHL